jgi:hypothetical protein
MKFLVQKRNQKVKIEYLRTEPNIELPKLKNFLIINYGEKNYLKLANLPN